MALISLIFLAGMAHATILIWTRWEQALISTESYVIYDLLAYAHNGDWHVIAWRI